MVALTPRLNSCFIKELISPNYHDAYNQERLVEVLSEIVMQRWIKEFILGELKLLFMRTRLLDNSKTNRVIQDFLTILCPKFAKSNQERLIAIVRKTWNNWRKHPLEKIMSKVRKVP